MTMYENRLWVLGKVRESSERRSLHAPFHQELIAETHQLPVSEMPEVIAAAERAFASYRKVSAYARSRLLTVMAQGIAARRKAIAERITCEAGKPWMLSDTEISRAIITFTIAAEEAKRLGGEVIPLSQDASGKNYEPALSYFVARGPVLAITPFNFPLNLAAHKVAPALAVGASVLLKPPPQAPGAAVLLAEIFAEAVATVAKETGESIDLATLQVVHCSNEAIGKAIEDPRLSILSFTGSAAVGWHLQKMAVRKRVALELGGNASVIINHDADLSRAAARCVFGGFSYAGQVCISVQKIYTHADVFEKFSDLLIQETRKVKTGNPMDEGCLVGPVIDAAAADRIMKWIDEAKAKGAKVLIGGERKDNVILPTILTGVDERLPVACEEVFGPVVILEKFTQPAEVIAKINASRYGLQTGIFSNDLNFIRTTSDQLDVGGILVNDVPTFRADNMPYGGVKDSGLGREGVRYAMEEFCERKTIVHWRG